MYLTLEVRWFFEGELPTEVYRWFMSVGESSSQPETRTDWYLYTPKNHNLGIKQRQGKLEIKQRLVKQGKCKLAKRVRGRPEQWMKWHFQLDADDVKPTSSELGEFWIEVDKKRWCQHYAMPTNGPIARVDSPEPVDQGCTFELAELQVGHQSWYSLCFETFGQAAALEPILKTVVQHIAENADFPDLKASHSYGYPDWLRQVRQKTP